MKNLIIRTITGIAFVALIVAAVLVSEWFLFLVFLIFACLGMYEYRTLLQKNSIKLSIAFHIVGLCIYFIFSRIGKVLLCDTIFLQSFCFGETQFMLVLALLFILFIVGLFSKQEQPFLAIAYSILGILWIVLPFALINHWSAPFPYELRLNEQFLLLSVFIFIWMYDTFAYCVGMLIGKHRLFERISPKKSWEGAIGSAILTSTAAYFANLLFPALPLSKIQWIGFALVIIVFGTLGDLVESLFKRQLSVKDSGTILPGHGGILDRFDSFLFAFPFVLLYLEILRSHYSIFHT